MSNHHILAAVSRQIRRLLWAGIKEDEATRSLIKSEQAIRIGPPNQEDPVGRLIIWLFQVRPNLYQADLPMRHITDIAEPNPLPLDLSYLITPILPGGDLDGAELVVLARVMQIMAANDHILFNEPGFEENVRVILEDIPLQEQILIWRALRAPMRIAAFYQLSPVKIDPLPVTAQS
jgi:hypothetical protein